MLLKISNPIKLSININIWLFKNLNNNFFKIKNSQRWYFAWENLWRFLLYLNFVLSSFCCWCSLFYFWSSFCCHLTIFFIHILLFDIIPYPSVDYCQVFRPTLYFLPSPSQCDSRHFQFLQFHYFLIASATVLSGCFLSTGIFYLMLLHRRLTQPAFIKASLGAGSSSLKFSGLYYWSLKHRPSPSTAWKVFKYGVSSGPYFPAFGLNTERYFVFSYSVRMRENTDQKKLRIWTTFTQWSVCLNYSKSTNFIFWIIQF